VALGRRYNIKSTCTKHQGYNVLEPKKYSGMKTSIKKKLAKKANRKEKRVVVMLLAKLGFKDLPITDKVIKARQVVKSMTGNPYFPSPNPSLPTVTVAINALEAAQQALDGSVRKTHTRNIARKTLDKLMGYLQTYVENIAMGDSIIVLSAGMGIRDERTRQSILLPPDSVTASATKAEGQAKVKCPSYRKKVVYVVEARPDEEGSLWKTMGHSTKATQVINNLIPGQRYRFRIRILNSAGLGSPSHEVLCRPI
jgi:hypothetical protein